VQSLVLILQVLTGMLVFLKLQSLLHLVLQ
jgi:hypothetical protein